MGKKFYFCNQCRGEIERVDDVLLVEGNFPRGFCSETCIRDFYSPLVDYFEEYEALTRQKLKVEEKASFTNEEMTEVLGEVLSKPDEIWVNKNELGEEYFVYLKQMPFKELKSVTFVTTCLVFERSPSFIFAQTCTTSNELINCYRMGSQVEDVSKFQKGDVTRLVDHQGMSESGGEGDNQNVTGEIIIDKKLADIVDQKKSSYLAELMERKGDDDIPIDNYPMYEDYLTPTLEDPDEIYGYTDKEGDPIVTYIKSHAEGDTSFFYFVLCYRHGDGENGDEEMLLPIISFPSLDGNLYREYRQGEQLAGGLKN